MRSKLLKSFIYVFGFWWLAFTVWWSLTDPATNLVALKRVAALLPFLPLSVPQGEVSVLQAWSMQKQVLIYWSVPLLVISCVMAAIGAGVVWALTYKEHKARIARETPTGKYRGATTTLGPLPVPKRTPRETLELGAADAEVFACMSDEEKTLLVDILGIISAHPNAYSGSGIGVSLLEHTVRVVEEALTSKNRPGLSAIVAAAHETGKITAYVKESNGEWKRTKNHDREAAKHLSTLDSWWAMPADVRLSVLFAVKYKQQPAHLPEVDGNPQIFKVAKDLLYRAAESTDKVTAIAKERVLAKQELPAVALKGFLDALPTLPFQDGLPKGVKGVGWKVGKRLYLLEMHLRNTIMAKLDPDIRGALEGAYKDRNNLAKFTQEFLKALDSKGWLVKEHNKTKLEAANAMWVILAGKFDYKGVIIIDVPQEYVEVLPRKDSMYEITIKGALYPPAANQGVTTDKLAAMGLLHTNDAPAPAAPRATAPAPTANPAAPSAPSPASTSTPTPAAAPASTGAAVATPVPAKEGAKQGIKTSDLADLGLFHKAEPAKPAPTKQVPPRTAD